MSQHDEVPTTRLEVRADGPSPTDVTCLKLNGQDLAASCSELRLDLSTAQANQVTMTLTVDDLFVDAVAERHLTAVRYPLIARAHWWLARPALQSRRPRLRAFGRRFYFGRRSR